MSTGRFTQPDYTSQEATAYKTALDGAALVHNRVAGPFAPHAQDTPDMTVAVDAGAIPALGDLPLEVAAQSTGALPAPSVNPRRDIVYVDQTTGVVGVATGAEAASPSDPELDAGKVAVARVNLTTAMTEITNADLDDVRALGWLGMLDFLVDGEAGDGSGLTGVVAVGVELDATPDSDHSAEGITETLTAGEALVFGDACYVKSDGKLWKADADAESTMPVEYLALGSINADASGSFLKFGIARDDSWSWTPGGEIYASATAGGLTQTLPTPGDQVQVVGYAKSADVMLFAPHDGRGAVVGRTYVSTTSLGDGTTTTISGLGFRPRTVQLVVSSVTDDAICWGQGDGTNESCTYLLYSGGYYCRDTYAVWLDYASSINLVANLTLVDDGFVLTWDVTGSLPSGNVMIQYTAIK